jgi:tRNA(fMet)-specific endonuclease VapC
MRYLLNPDFVSDLVRNPQGRAAAKIAEVGEDAVATSIIVEAELHCGAAKKGSQRLNDQLEAVLGTLDILPLEPPADSTYGAAELVLEGAGLPIGAIDLLIAARALALDMVVGTDSDSRVKRVEGLKVENW